ncbi:DUF3658 domain-containing protein [Thiocapsa bogorovii]|uniref:DUF3658 domain-containing protein n=1 Tax=Thiocapsa bogorovii TaxID=521689 RepID=UPI001E5E2D16|nr:DUF3658 domain-containing protein [Thiocapsa bogorovii]UHD14746.1 DUF3658 domain-containing protein [Thiocapsa bogorovii]
MIAIARRAVPVPALCFPGVLAVQPAFWLPTAIKATISHWNPKVLLIAFSALPKPNMPSTQPDFSKPLAIGAYPDLARCLSFPRHAGNRVRSPRSLAELFSSAQELSDAESSDFAEDFLRLRRETGLLRRWEQGRILGVPTDRYDPLLLQCCTTRWTPAARVVGTVMSRGKTGQTLRYPHYKSIINRYLKFNSNAK